MTDFILKNQVTFSQPINKEKILVRDSKADYVSAPAMDRPST